MPADGATIAKDDPSLTGPAASNPFMSELGLLTKLVAPRVSRAKDDASLPAPKPVRGGPGRKRRSVPPLNEVEVAVGEVQTLPTHGKLQLATSSTNHSGLKEMLIARKARHEQAFEAYKKRIGQLDVELEARTAHVARSFKQLMALNDAELKTMFEELADDFLLQMEMNEVDSSWMRIDEELHRRFSWVTQFEADLGKVEDERRQMVEAELTILLEALVATAHLLPPQLERLVETETHEINLLILSNREAHADVIARLRIDDVKRHKANRLEWEARKAAWRTLRHNHALVTMKSYLHSPEVIAPPQQQELLAELADSQQAHHERRVAITGTLSQLTPPILTFDAAAAVRKQLEQLLAEEAANSADVRAKLLAAEATVAAEVADAAEYLRSRLAHFAAHAPDELTKIYNRQIAPLLGLRTEQAKDLLLRVERAEMRQRLKLHEDALALTARFEGAGKIFDAHSDATKQLYASLRADLAQLRAESEAGDKEAEFKLEEALMAMRRAADKDGLAAFQDEAMALLNAIQTGYRDFHSASLERIGNHPGLVATEVATLEANLVAFHHVVPKGEYEGGSESAPAEAPAAEPPTSGKGRGRGKTRKARGGRGAKAEMAKEAADEAAASANATAKAEADSSALPPPLPAPPAAHHNPPPPPVGNDMLSPPSYGLRPTNTADADVDEGPPEWAAEPVAPAGHAGLSSATLETLSHSTLEQFGRPEPLNAAAAALDIGAGLPAPLPGWMPPLDGSLDVAAAQRSGLGAIAPIAPGAQTAGRMYESANAAELAGASMYESSCFQNASINGYSAPVGQGALRPVVPDGYNDDAYAPAYDAPTYDRVGSHAVAPPTAPPHHHGRGHGARREPNGATAPIGTHSTNGSSTLNTNGTTKAALPAAGAVGAASPGGTGAAAGGEGILERVCLYEHNGEGVVYCEGAPPPFAVYAREDGIKLVVSTFNLQCEIEERQSGFTIICTPDTTKQSKATLFRSIFGETRDGAVVAGLESRVDVVLGPSFNTNSIQVHESKTRLKIILPKKEVGRIGVTMHRLRGD